MAIVRPYGDPKAHGKLNDSLAFRRGRCIVILQTKPCPKISKTPGQIKRRNAIVEANKSYSILTQDSKHFYAKRAGQRRKNRKTMFMWAKMNNRVPSTLRPILARSIENMIIYNPVGDHPDTIEFSVYNLGGYPDVELWNPMDSIWNGSVPSETGPDGTISGSLETTPGKFENALKQSSVNSRVSFPDELLDWDHGYCGFWLQTDFDVELGYPQDMDDRIHAMTVGSSIGDISFHFGQAAGARVLTFHTWFEDLTLAGIEAASWTAGTWVHICHAWDRYSTYGWTNAVFLNGTLVKPGTTAWTAWHGTYRDLNILGPRAHPGAGFGRIAIDDVITNSSVANLPEVLGNINAPGARNIKFYAQVLDNSNDFQKISEVDDPQIQILRISTMAGYSADVPFRYLIAVEWKDMEDETVNSVIRLPELYLEALQIWELYLSRDWSVYWDPHLRRLACTNWV